MGGAGIWKKLASRPRALCSVLVGGNNVGNPFPRALMCDNAQSEILEREFRIELPRVT